MSKSKETVNGASVRMDALHLVILPVGWEKGEGNAGILLLSCFRQTPKTPPTAGLSGLLPASFTSLEKIHSFSLLGRQKLFQSGEDGFYIHSIDMAFRVQNNSEGWGFVWLSEVAVEMEKRK